jgi:threonylcarbamoyladenosine tRNA methylthiotransferase MtaB
MKNSVYITYAGCKVNQFEKSILIEFFQKAGFSITENPKDAEYIIFNTCAVTDKAEQGCRQIISKLHRLNPNAKIILTGCYTEKENNLKDFPGVWKIFTNSEKIFIPSILTNNEIKNSHPLQFEYTRTYKDRARSFLKIQDGCDAFCSYCIVPFLRGRPISMPLELVIKNLHNLRDENEVVLTGIHLGKWGIDINSSFETLMESIKNEHYPFRIRLSSLEANEITPTLLQILSEMENLCHHFHIPLQSGSNKILQLMKRKYDTSTFEKKIELIRKFFPNACIGIDIIVGFPKEDELCFQETLTLLNNIPIDYMHIFTYSPRKGTEAYEYDGKVDRNTTYERYNLLKEIDSKKRKEFIKRFVNKEVLCIEDKILDKNTYRVLSREYLKLFIKQEIPKKEFKAKLIDENTLEAVLVV